MTVGTAVANVIVFAGVAYATMGVVFATAFLALGIRRVDHAAAGSPWGFYVLVFPGVAALWPVMAWKWARATRRAS